MNSNYIKHIILPLFLFIAYHSTISAQDYKTLIGYKDGNGSGIMIKRLLPNESAFSTQAIIKDGGFSIGGFRTFHEVAFPQKSSKFFFYYGYGTHFRYYRYYKSRNLYTPFSPAIKHKGNYFAFGLDGVVGLEYRFLKYPFVLASEYNPNFEFGGATYFRVNMDLLMVSIAYTF